jgi:hypothetical protein
LSNFGSNTVSTTGNVTSGNLVTSGIVSASGNIDTTANVNAANVNFNRAVIGNIDGSSITADGRIFTSGNVVAGNVNSNGILFATGNIAGPHVNVTGNVVAGNVNSNGLISATGNITGGNILTSGNISGNNINITNHVAAGYITSAGNITNTGNIDSTGHLSAVGNIVTTANVNTGNINVNRIVIGNISNSSISADGRIFTSGNVVAGNINSDGILFATGNVVGANVNVSGLISAAGNVIGNYFIGNGSQLTGIVASGGSSIDNGTSNVAIATANGNVTVTVAESSTWTFDNTGNLNLPNNGSINFAAGGITQATDEDFVITVNDADDDGFAIFNRITDEDGNVVGQTELQRDRFNINLDMLGSNYQWEFSDFNGTMTLPGNIQGTYGDNTSFYAVDDGDSGSVEMKTISYVGDTLGSNIRVTQSNATISTSNAAYTWTFDNTGNLTAPGNISMDWLDVGNIGNIAVLAADVKLQITADAGNTAPYWTFNNDGTLFVPGNISGDNSAPLIVEGSGSGEGYISLPHATFGGEQVAIVNKFGLGNGIRLETNGGNLFFDDTGNLTVPGNIIMPPGTALTGSGASPAPSISGFTSISAETLSATGNVTSANVNTSRMVLGNIGGSSITADGRIFTSGNVVAGNINSNGILFATGNIAGPHVNVTGNVVAGNVNSNGVIFATGNITGGNISATGNVTVTGNLNVTGTAGNVATKSSGAWTVTPGTNNYSFTVDSSNTYQMWVEGNIANGIIAWNALATITNTNVPVIGQQFAWNYEGAGNPIVFTSIPAQIIGTAGAISNASPAVANTNVFTFGINNTSGSNQTVRYGWVRIS